MLAKMDILNHTSHLDENIKKLFIFTYRKNFMLTFQELKDKIESFPQFVEDQQTKNEIKQVASQLGYTVPDCKCQDKFNDLVIKLKLWSRQHPTECHYQMRPGIVRRGPEGNVYNLNLTDETAEWILENDPEGAKYITKIASETLESAERSINQEKDLDVPQEPKKRSRKKKSDA